MFEATEVSSAILKSILAELRPYCGVLADYVERAAQVGVWKDTESGALLLSPQQTRGPQAYDVVLFPAAANVGSNEIVGYLDRPLPSRFGSFLCHANGAFIGDLSIYGIISELNRSVRAPLDIGMGDIWRVNYAPCDNQMVLFASRNVSASGQIGYFVSKDGKVLGRGNEETNAPADAGSWDRVEDWLEHQISLNKEVEITRSGLRS